MEPISGKFWWLVLITVIWPVAHVLVFLVRFQRVSADVIVQSLVFLPLGFLSALVLLRLLPKAVDRRQKTAVVAGYIVASPVAFIGSLLGGLMVTPLLGATIFGLIPLAVGMAIGFYVVKLSAASAA